MGFSSWLCAKTDQSIPAYPYAERPAELSHVVMVLPDNTTIEGYYDGYGNIHTSKDFPAYLTPHTEAAYHAYRDAKAGHTDIWDVIKATWAETIFFQDFVKLVKMVRFDQYAGETYEQLKTSKMCPNQGYFY